MCFSRAALLFLVCVIAGSRAVEASPQQRGATRSPHGNLAIACENCHTSTSWKPIRPRPDFNHNQTSYPLRGLHAKVACMTCHTSLVFSQAETRCSDCHADVHRRQFGGDCESCHTVRGWRVSPQSIKEHVNRFPLLGAHAAVDCEACHKGAAVARFTGLSTACVSCHLTDLQSAARISFDHQAAQVPTNCETCHSMDSWLGAKFDHARYAGFALTGAHASLDCASCHANSRFKGTPADCFSCHAKDFQGAQNPNHVAASFPTTCSICHGTDSWLNAKFDHNMTKFPLTGAHTTLQCSACHGSGNYTLVFTGCASCHLADFQKTTDPNHVAAGFPQDCSVCHSTTNWAGATFNHNQTRFPLTGAHATVSCNQCHGNNVFAGTPTDCASCHTADFNKTTNPNHVTAGFPTDCTVCHTTTAWQPASFDHSKTGFLLTGAHVTVPCASCHVNGKFAGTPTACAGCHLADWNKTTDPNHAAAGFPQDCSVCHSTTSWSGAIFNHNTATQFPLTGAHASLKCSDCHASGVFAGLPTACASCHLKDFNGAANPNHVAAGFPQDCSICHSTTAWQPAPFDHSKTPFPLTGAHTTVPCASCHVGGKFAGTPTDCYSCHTADYKGTTNPNHTAAAFPTTCQTCHTTTAWTGATFNHTWFPIPHRTATQCSDCHTNPSDYSVFVCTNCHTQANTNGEHRGVKGYVWNSANCYQCHPRGTGG